MSEREFKSASEAVEFYREQVRTQNGYAMQQRLRAEQAEAERDRLEEECQEANAENVRLWAERDRLREENAELRLALAASDSDGQYAKLYEETRP